MFKKLILKSVQFTAAGFATTAVYYLLVSSESSYHRSQLDGFIRSLRNSTRAALILYQSVVDYKDSLKDIPYNTEEYHAERSRVHTRTANRILSLSQQNKGIYLKLGQYLGNLDKIVPWEFTSVLKVLQDSAPPLPFQQIKVVLEHDLHTPFEKLFECNEQAIAAASLAQVHRGILRENGQTVAIKIQYPFLGTQSWLDLLVLKQITNLCNYLLCKYKSSQIDLIKLFETWTNTLIDELDFELQVEQAQKTNSLFKDNEFVYIPHYYKQLSSKRVIVMEFVEGVKINDKAGLEKLNISPKAVRENLIDIFTTMIFQYGYVHCDAHPGNILVRKQNNRLRHEIILLDHGLYRTIRPETIRSFSGLWLSLMMGDTKQVEHYAKDLNIERHLEYLPIIFLQRTKNSCKPIGANFTLSERKQVKQKDLVNFDSINDILQDLPPELMFIIRASNLIAIHNLALGGTTRNRLFTYAKHSLRALHTRRVGFWVAYLFLRIKIWVYEKYWAIMALSHCTTEWK